ncbi:MAG TPA: DEAD/DEAH box helicase [bacterium]|nr:DEAD/DEAH box helicase [bacterium]
MNEHILHFLPSVVRGVYRYDDLKPDFEKSAQLDQFYESRLNFLPPYIRNLIERNRKHSNLSPQSKSNISKEPSNNLRNKNAIQYVTRYPKLEKEESFLEKQFVYLVLSQIFDIHGMLKVVPQYKVGPYYIDFGILADKNYAIELDGFGKFRTSKDLDDFLNRQNYILQQGWTIYRYSYNKIMKSTEVAKDELTHIFQKDSMLRQYLLQCGNLIQKEDAGDIPDDRNIVNAVYRIQDIFVSHILSNNIKDDTVNVKDHFGFGWPIVALSLNYLYDTIYFYESILDIRFEIPKARIDCGGSPERMAKINAKIDIASVESDNAVVFNSDSIFDNNFTMPAPAKLCSSINYKKNMSLDNIHSRLNFITSTVFRYETGTNPFQDKVLKRYFSGKDTLGISATGSGKSFCFWLPSLIKPGLTLVISPLRTLMKDQFLSLLNYGIASVAYINSDVHPEEQKRILHEAKLGYIRMLYISPERLRIKKFVDELLELQQYTPINCFAIDEAHCISEWGHDFRPSYLKLPQIRESLCAGNESDIRLIALTATAGEMVKRDIEEILHLKSGEYGDVIKESIADRERFSYQIVSVNDPKHKDKTYKNILKKQIPISLKHKSFDSLMKSENKREEKSVGLVFCIYADSHGKDGINDGVPHYLFLTKDIVEPSELFRIKNRKNHNFNPEAYSEGRVRGFSSKTPTFCPKCLSYRYCMKSSISFSDNDFSFNDDDDDKSQSRYCMYCDSSFNSEDIVSIDNETWKNLLSRNQGEFKQSKFDVLVSTKGFGMGIDKGSVRFVVHTCLSSGMEGWYQEVGRAGRDKERAHIVMLTCPPSDECKKQMSELPIQKPSCSYRKGCTFGKPALCDYGKQHMLINSSYKGAENDAMWAISTLEKLLINMGKSQNGGSYMYSGEMYSARDEIAIYRLMLLGIVKDYSIRYVGRRQIVFDIDLGFDSFDNRTVLLSLIQDKLAAYSHKRMIGAKVIDPRNPRRSLRDNYTDFETIKKTRKNKFTKFNIISSDDAFLEFLYYSLLAILDHTYNDVLKMRYTMLYTLLSVVNTTSCRRAPILRYFGETVEESYRCESCDICRPDLNFLDSRVAPIENRSDMEMDKELSDFFASGNYDYFQLSRLVAYFKEYPSSKYMQARRVLEGDPNNLPALFISREFSPPADLGGNTKRLLSTANQRLQLLSDVETLFETSKDELKTDLLLLLNESDTVCDNVDGWNFLLVESSKERHLSNSKAQLMNECLDFFLLTEDNMLKDSLSSASKIIGEMTNA